MKLMFFLLLALPVLAADTLKLSAIPLNAVPSSVAINDSFPYVPAATLTAKRLKISDILGIPQFVTKFALYAPLASPTFSGTVTGTFSGNLTGTSTNVTGIVAAANGGTGLSSVGTSGNVLTSNGTSWVSSAPASSGVTSVATGTGLTGGPITSIGTISLADTAVSAGAYTNANITVDAQGRLTAAANGSSGGSFASQDLSNVVSTSIPVSLNPSAPASSDLGNATNSWNNVYLKKIFGRNSGSTNFYLTAIPENSYSVATLSPTLRSDNSGGLNLVASSATGYLTLESANFIYLKAARTYVETDFYPATTGTWDLGKQPNTFKSLYLSDGIYNGTSKQIDLSLQSLKDGSGDSLYYGSTATGTPDLVVGRDGSATPRGLRFTNDSGANKYIGFRGKPGTAYTSVVYNLPPDGTSGQVWTTDGAGNISWTTPSSSSSAISAEYKTAAAQAIANNTVTIIDFGTSSFDSLIGTVTTGASWKFTATEQAEYDIKATLTFYQPALLAANQVMTMYIYKNGSFFKYLDIGKTQGAVDVFEKHGSTNIRLAIGDYFDIRVLQQTGISQSLLGASEANYINITKVGSY